jgi:hypothetical protein
MEGYARIADMMGQRSCFTIFRAFRALNIQKLLYLQAEILHLEEELQQLVRRDASDPERQFHSKDWWSLSQGDSIEDREQWEKMLELGGLLDKYSAWCSIRSNLVSSASVDRAANHPT